MCLYNNNPVIRNRSNILQKGKSGHLRTPAKIQFAPIWNFFYANVEKFQKLNEILGFETSVYGEWMYALHSVKYDKLPNYFVAYDVYDWTVGKFIKAREALIESGFNVVPLLHYGKVVSFEFLEGFMAENSPFSSSDLREGIYIKVSDGKYITHRFKWVREGFIQGAHWSKTKLTQNKLA